MTEYAAIRIVFHPAGVVHLYPLAAMLARDQSINSEAPVY